MNSRQISLRAKLTYAFATIPLMILVLALVCFFRLSKNTQDMADQTRSQLDELFTNRSQLQDQFARKLVAGRLETLAARLEGVVAEGSVRALLADGGAALRSAVSTTATEPGEGNAEPAPESWLEGALRGVGSSFLTVVNAKGRTVARATNAARSGDDLFARDGGENSADLKGLLEKAFKGKTITSVELLPSALLREELVTETTAIQGITSAGDTLADQARLAAQSYPEAAFSGEENRGLALLAVAPVLASDGRPLGAVFAGTLINRNAKLAADFKESFTSDGFVVVTLQALRVLSLEAGDSPDKPPLGVSLPKDLWTQFQQNPEVGGLFDTGRGAAFCKLSPIKDHRGRVIGSVMAGVPGEFSNRVLAAIDARSEAARADTKRAIVEIGLIILGLTIAVGYSLSVRITGPIQYLIEVSRAITEGDYGRRAEIASGDEFGELAAAFNQMAATINEKIRRAETLIGQIQASASGMSSTTGEISAIVQRQVAGATEQAASVNEVTTTSEEIAATARQISDNAASVKDIANEATRACGKGTDDTTVAIQGMSSLKDHVQSIAESMLVLGKNSQKIGEVINIIDEISKQTNLLSLNAAIEAAGAGEEGKRFAVVAVEVKRLADRTVDATKQIKQLIDMIQNSTNKTILLTEEGSKSVDAGFRMVEQVGKSLENIVTLVKKTARAANEISLSTGQQTTATDNMAQSISDVSRVAAQVLKSSEDTRKAVDDINDLADKLRRLVGEESLGQPK